VGQKNKNFYMQWLPTKYKNLFDRNLTRLSVSGGILLFGPKPFFFFFFSRTQSAFFLILAVIK